MIIIKIIIAICELFLATPMFIMGFLWEIFKDAFKGGRIAAQKMEDWIVNK